MDYLLFVISVLIVIAVIVGFHELGHFVAAKWSGVHVLKFKIGFGKELFSRPDKNGTDFSIGILPLGGYIQMLGEHDFPDYKKIPNPEKLKTYSEASLKEQAIIAFAGPFANLILAVLAFSLVFMIGVKDLAPLVGHVQKGSLAEEYGLQTGSKILEVDGYKINSFTDINTRLASRMGESGTIDIKYIHNESYKSTSIEINDWLNDSSQISPINQLGISPFRPPIIESVVEGSAASEMGLFAGDKITSVNEIEILTQEDLIQEISSRPEEEVQFVIERDGEALSKVWVIPSVNVDGKIKGRLGIYFIPISKLPNALIIEITHNPITALAKGTERTIEYTLLILDSIKKLIFGQVSTDNIGGPIQIAQLSGSAAKAGLVPFITFLAIMSINLGLINLLPIPVLDGGRLVLIGIEKIKGSELSEAFIEYSYRIGVFLILGLSIFAIFNDISRTI